MIIIQINRSYFIRNLLQQKASQLNFRQPMETDLTCPLCQDQYTDQNLPRLLAVCGHTFCQKCLRKILTEADEGFKIICPEDNQMVSLKDKNLDSIPKNRALLKIIESKKKNSSFKDPELEMSKIVKNQEIANQDEEAQALVNAIVLSTSIGSQQKIGADKQQQTKIQSQHDKSLKIQKQQINQKKATQLCKAHQKPLEVVCIIDLKRICVNCAIFGQHKGHQFKSLEQIQTERMSYYTQLLKIMDKKEIVSTRISNSETCSAIMQLLSNKKEKMKSSINEKFKKLVQTIQNKQKQSLKNLDNLMVKTQTKFKALMKIDPKILQKYDEWQQKSYQQIKILEGDDFESKLRLLFLQPTEQVDVIQSGETIIDQMNKQEQNMLNEVEQALENMGIDFNSQIMNHIDSFVQIYDEPKKKKSKSRMKTQVTPSHHNINTKTNLSIKKQELKQIKFDQQSQKIQSQTKKQIKAHHHHHHEEDLLQIEFAPTAKKPQFMNSAEMNLPISIQKLQEPPTRKQKDVISPTSKIVEKIKIEAQKSPRVSLDALGRKQQSSFIQQKLQRPNKKKLAKVKWPQKYQKIVDGIANDQLETVDLTNAQLGDANIVLLAQFMNGSKARTVKLIRNKLTDDAIFKILPYMKSVLTLNISQNLLTERVLDILIEGRAYLESMRSIILSQNKIMERKAKPKLDKLKSMDLTITI